MEEVRQLVQEEGREARNLVAFHVAVDTPSRISRKPPRAGAPPLRRTVPRTATRLRSASAGRDKRSELRARYWALLFGDLQRAVGEIYNTVEAHENLNECQEVILVLENYTRDFKALGEWFRLKWEYDNTPPPQRPQSLAWEIRKTDFVRPESRKGCSVKSSPSVSGKNSPSLSGHNTPSGKNSPNLTGKASPGSGKISPRITGHSNTNSPKGNIEFFSNKVSSKITAKPEPKSAKELSRLSDIKEKELKDVVEIKEAINGIVPTVDDKEENASTPTLPIVEKDQKPKLPIVEIGKAKECPSTSPKMVVVKSPKRAVLQDEFKPTNQELSSQAKATIAKLDAMENEFLEKHLMENAAKNDNLLNLDKEVDCITKAETNENPEKNVESVNDIEENIYTVIDNITSLEKDYISSESPSKDSEDNFGDISNESSYKSSDEKSSPNKKPDKVAKTDKPVSDNVVKSVEISKTDKFTEIPEVSKTDKVPQKTEVSKTDKVAKKTEVSNIDKVSKTTDSGNTDKIAKKTEITKPDGITKTADSGKSDEVGKGNKVLVVTQLLKVGNQVEPEVKNSLQDNSEQKLNVSNGLENTKLSGDITKKSEESKDNFCSDNKDIKKDHEQKKIDSKIAVEKPRPAYSQAAAKPKTASTVKVEVKTPTRLIARSKTVVEMLPGSAAKAQRQFLKRNQGSKCSYPFNLTTGRTSLFDAPANKSVTKKPVNKAQMGSGDNKNISKVDLKKRPPRPASLKINEEGNKKDKINMPFNKKDGAEYSSSDTMVTQIDMSRIESSESLKTLVPDDFDAANSVEVLNVDSIKNDNDGWLTVKSRRLSRESKKQSKSHWANRFHQPSATTSLPTLNMIESPKQEIKEIISSSKLDRAKSEQPQNKPDKPKMVKPKPEIRDSKKDLSIIRQKSDVTGLKTRTSKSKALKREKTRPKDDRSDLTKNRLHSSLESLTTGLARSQEKTEETFDFDKWKSEFKTTFKFLDEDDQINDHNEILKSADPSEMSEIAEMTSQIEENERKISWALDFQSEVDQRKLCEEEDLLNRQIMELQQVSDIDLDTETDDTETDAEIFCEETAAGAAQSTENLSLTASLEDQYETALAGMSWAERVDTLGALEALVARDPGRAQQLHVKLSAGMRRRGSLQDALRRLQLKQARAERQRQALRTERARRIHTLLARVEEVKVAKNQLIEEKRLRMERRLQKAAENRDQHLKDIVRKAHDEEEKLREIAFIKQLEAENRRHEFLDQCRSHTTRLRLMRRDRLSKLEQKAAREAAVGARRQALEAARKLHVETLLEKRKERDARVEELKEQKKQERDDAAREKAEGVKSRLSALAAAAELEADALRSRIRDKQDASQQRLESHLQAIREKATGPRQATTSESLDPTSKEEKELQEEAERLEEERKEKERQKAIKKKARKVKQKLLLTSNTKVVIDENVMIEILTPATTKTCKAIHNIQHLLEPLAKCLHCCRSHDHSKHDKDKKTDTHGIDKDNIDESNQENNENDNITQEITHKNNKSDHKLNEITNEKVDLEIEFNGFEKTENEKKKQKKKKIVNGDVDEKESNTINNNNKEIEDVEGNTNKKKKKKGADKDRAKLSKTSSVCSSLSDMSRGSGRGEKVKPLIDMPYLERQLNELIRMIDKLNKGLPTQQRGRIKGLGTLFLHGFTTRMPRSYTAVERSAIHKMHLVTVLTRMLALVVEREDDVSRFPNKAVFSAVQLLSSCVSSCPASAAHCTSSAAPVQLVRLLALQLEKDLQDDPKEMELAVQLSDCLSLTLDTVLCATRLYEEKRDLVKDDLQLLTYLRTRAHTLVSYLCWTGCMTLAENAGDARQNIQALLTVCADLCHPSDADVGSERLSATQALRSALGTSVIGSRDEFCMLFAQGAGLEHSGGFVKAARTAHLLRALAELDYSIVQDAFGEGGWPLEFRAAVARLLSQHAPTEKEAPRTTALRLCDQRLDQSLSEAMVLDLIVLVGFVIVNNPQLQETICDGWGVIKTLCTLPANWLVSTPQCNALLPTLVALAEQPDIASAIASELSMEMLEEFMDSPEAQEIKLVQVIKQGRAKRGKK